VSNVIVGNTPSIKRQHRLRAFRRLNLALLVNAQHDGVIGRVEIEPDDVVRSESAKLICGEEDKKMSNHDSDGNSVAPMLDLLRSM
jgi:hypothetical protein